MRAGRSRIRVVRRVLPLAWVLLAAVPAAAQQRAAPFVTAPAAPVLSADTVPDTAAVKPKSQGERLAVRTAGGSLGWVLGGVVGVFAGLAFEGEAEGEWDGLDDAVIGALIGTVAGGAAGAAMPNYRRECRFGTRFGRGLLGSAVGTVVGLAFATSTDDGVASFVVPVTGGLGAAIAADC